MKYLSVEKRVERFKRFYMRSNKRSLLGFFVGDEYPLHRYKAARGLPENRELIPEDFMVSQYMEDCERLFYESESCSGDFIWSGSAFWGIPWVEAVLGCSIHASKSTGSINSSPPVDFKEDKKIPHFDRKSPWVVKTGEFLRTLAQKSDGRWPIGTTRMRGISDLLSALYGGVEFVYAMLENPNEVKEVCKKITDLWINYGKYQLELIPTFYGGIGTYSYNLWAEIDTVFLQEDAAALLSPDLYDEFIRPCNEEIVKAFHGCIIHQHSTGFVPVESYIKMGMTALEIHRDTGGASCEEMYDCYLSILKSKPLLIWGSLTEMDLDFIFQKIPPQGLAAVAFVKDIAEAESLWEKYIECE
jgi:hypothetical protein